MPVGALLGACAAMGLVWVGTGRGFSSPARMLLIGIGVSAVSLAFVQYVITRAGREQATVLAAYLNGSLASRTWSDAVVIGVGVVALLPCALALTRRLQLMEMGDEQADALGARSGATRLLAVLVAIVLAAAAVSAAGPIAFIALTAPQIARRLARTAGPHIVLSALMGAFLLTLADLLTQQSPLEVTLPVGIVTAGIGGIYLGYLLIREWNKGTVELEHLSPPPRPPRPPRACLRGGCVLAYDGHVVVDDLSIDIPDGGFTIIVGPNACGKSTLLEGALAHPEAGGRRGVARWRPIESYRSKAVARQVALLPQSPIAPEAITVRRDLVGRGWFPHQSLWQQWSAEDERAVTAALAATNGTELANRHVAELSGGQRQRVWMAMVLAQQTELLLLDEPTTFLDIAHQYDVLELCSRLHAEGRTLVAALHDLNQAALLRHQLGRHEGWPYRGLRRPGEHPHRGTRRAGLRTAVRGHPRPGDRYPDAGRADGIGLHRSDCGGRRKITRME